MLTLSTDTLPEDFSLQKLFGMVERTTPIQLSDQSLIKRLSGQKAMGHQDALDGLIEAAINLSDGEANVIYGVRVSTAIHTFANETFLYLTYVGTVAQVEM